MGNVIKHLAAHPVFVCISIVGTIVGLCADLGLSGNGFFVGATLLLLLVIGVGKYRPKVSASLSGSEIPSTVTHLEERQFIDCRYCSGKGSVAARWDSYKIQYATCPICSGKGRIFTELWSQPDCRRCNGSGALVSNTSTVISYRRRIHRQTFTDVDICPVCLGIGKEAKAPSSSP